MVWSGLVLWHINHCRLFNAESIFIREYSKLAQKEYKTRHDKWGRESTGNCAKKQNLIILPNGTCPKQKLSWRILLDFEIQTDHLIPARSLDLVMINKKRSAVEWTLPSQSTTE